MKAWQSKFKVFLLVVFTLISTSTFAQFTTPDDDIPPFGPGWNPGNWVGDTIITRPIIGIGNPINSPSAPTTITAVYSQPIMMIASTSRVTFTYEIVDDCSNTVMCATTSSVPALPVMIDLTSLPTGRYTLLLYINNECLEGEFEKE